MRFPSATRLVILSRGFASEALAWTRAVMTKLGLTLNDAKTSVKDARREGFDFLGYTLGPRHLPKGGPLVSRRKPVQEERVADQHQGQRPAEAGKHGRVARCAQAAEPASGWMGGVLLARNLRPSL